MPTVRVHAYGDGSNRLVLYLLMQSTRSEHARTTAAETAAAQERKLETLNASLQSAVVRLSSCARLSPAIDALCVVTVCSCTSTWFYHIN